MRKLFFLLLMLQVACASLSSQEIRLSAAQLQTAIEKQLTGSHEIFPLVELRIASPAVTLQPQENRILASMQIELSEALTGSSRAPLRGVLALSGRPSFEAATSRLVLAEPRIETLDLVDMPGAQSQRQQQMMRGIAKFLMKELSIPIPLYEFKPEKLRYGGVQYQPGDFAVTGDAIKVTLNPLR